VNDARARIRGFLRRFLRNVEFRDDENLFAEGLINSLFALQLVAFLEKEFRVRIENEDLELGNFRSIDALASLVHRKTEGRVPCRS